MTEVELRELGEIPWLNGVDYRARAGSTNDLALREPLADGDGWGWLFVAGEQTAGRGRRGNAWWAGRGALTFSLVVDAAILGIAAEQWPLLPLASGLGVRDAVLTALPDASVLVKWPNDVYLNDRKVAGILVEQRRDLPHRLVVGIGVNVNTEMTGAPADLAESAIALRAVGGSELALMEVLGMVLVALERRLGQIADEPARLVEELNECAYLTGRQVRVDSDAGSVIGACRGIADNGGLQVATAAGLQILLGGTVTSLGDG